MNLAFVIVEHLFIVAFTSADKRRSRSSVNSDDNNNCSDNNKIINEPSASQTVDAPVL